MRFPPSPHCLGPASTALAGLRVWAGRAPWAEASTPGALPVPRDRPWGAPPRRPGEGALCSADWPPIHDGLIVIRGRTLPDMLASATPACPSGSATARLPSMAPGLLLWRKASSLPTLRLLRDTLPTHCAQQLHCPWSSRLAKMWKSHADRSNHPRGSANPPPVQTVRAFILTASPRFRGFHQCQPQG